MTVKPPPTTIRNKITLKNNFLLGVNVIPSFLSALTYYLTIENSCVPGPQLQEIVYRKITVFSNKRLLSVFFSYFRKGSESEREFR
jgi:hypothetical protein